MRIVLIFLILPFYAFSQLQFKNIPLHEAFQQAKIENKPVFLFIYLDGCSHCDEFKETFKSMTEGATYYNDNFINAKVELNTEEGKAIRFKWDLNVLSTPLFTFWSADSTLLSIEPSTDILNNETAIIEMGKKAQNPKLQWEQEKKSVESETNIGRLAQLAYKARFVKDTVTNMAALDRYVTIKGLNNINVNEYILIKQTLTDIDSPLFTYLMNNKQAFVNKYGQKDVYGTIENIVMFSLLSSKSQMYDANKINFMKMALQSIGLPQQTIKARFLLYETNKYFALGENDKATALFVSYYQGQASVHPNEAAFIKKHFKEKTGNSELPKDLKKLVESKLQKKAN